MSLGLRFLRYGEANGSGVGGLSDGGLNLFRGERSKRWIETVLFVECAVFEFVFDL